MPTSRHLDELSSSHRTARLHHGRVRADPIPLRSGEQDGPPDAVESLPRSVVKRRAEEYGRANLVQIVSTDEG